jgi:hypothetical protein
VIQLRAVFAQRMTLLRPSTHQPRTVPVFNGAARLIANHLDLAIFGSAPEVRALCSAFAAAATPSGYAAPVGAPSRLPPSD